MHKPVLLNEVLKYLNPRPGGVFIDATINGGGHAQAIAERIGSTGKLLGIDRDCEIIKSGSLRSTLNAIPSTLICDSFKNIKTIAEHEGFTNADGILFDLGFSSFHIEESGRGFSFKTDEPLDMRYNRAEGISAAELINSISEDELRSLLYTLGEERYARNIARSIVRERAIHPIDRTRELVVVIEKSVPPRYRYSRIHCATRTFQALRMRVNDELDHVAEGIRGAVALLRTGGPVRTRPNPSERKFVRADRNSSGRTGTRPGGRIAVITFHSGEDRLIKQIFRDFEHSSSITRITKRVVRPSEEERSENPRARSAKLRVAEKI